MRYPIFIERGSGTKAFGIVVPDLPGCCSTGDTLEEALQAARAAVAAWIETALDRGMSVPSPSTLEDARKRPDYSEWAVGLLELEDPRA